VTTNLSTHRFVGEVSLSAGRLGRLFLPDDRLAHDAAKERLLGRLGPCHAVAPPTSGRRGTSRLGKPGALRVRPSITAAP
jgi:hypothetical protein